MNEPVSDRQALEDAWRDRVQASRIRLDFARNFVREIETDLNLGAKVRAECEAEYQHALRAEVLATEEYGRVLRAFKDLVVNGIIPAEDQGEAATAKGASGG